ncbi:NifU [Helicobacter cholecystus]|nr:NifU [Helicobacter cholecystus]
MIFTDEELLIPIQASIEKVRPYLLRDGGDMQLKEVKDGKVYIALQGACKSCPSSTITLKNKIEHQLKVDIHPDIEVIKVDEME